MAHFQRNQGKQDKRAIDDGVSKDVVELGTDTFPVVIKVTKEKSMLFRKIMLGDKKNTLFYRRTDLLSWVGRSGLFFFFFIFFFDKTKVAPLKVLCSGRSRTIIGLLLSFLGTSRNYYT